MEIFSTGGLDDFLEAGFVNGEIVRVPSIDTGLVKVAYGDLYVGAFRGDHGHGGAADVASAEAADGGDFQNFKL
jgi:hypothetical protein